MNDVSFRFSALVLFAGLGLAIPTTSWSGLANTVAEAEIPPEERGAAHNCAPFDLACVTIHISKRTVIGEHWWDVSLVPWPETVNQMIFGTGSLYIDGVLMDQCTFSVINNMCITEATAPVPCYLAKGATATILGAATDVEYPNDSSPECQSSLIPGNPLPRFVLDPSIAR